MMRLKNLSYELMLAIYYVAPILLVMALDSTVYLL